MIEKYLIAATIIVGIMLGWLLVQRIWASVFHEVINDEDVLADRRSCGDCGCGTSCELGKNKIDRSNIKVEL